MKCNGHLAKELQAELTHCEMRIRAYEAFFEAANGTANEKAKPEEAISDKINQRTLSKHVALGCFVRAFVSIWCSCCFVYCVLYLKTLV